MGRNTSPVKEDFTKKDEDHDCEKVHPKMSHKEWLMSQSPVVHKEGVIPNTQSAKQKAYNKFIKQGKHPDTAAEMVANLVAEDSSDYEKEQPIKVKKAIEIAKRMAGNYTGATKEIEKLAKGLSQLPVVKSVLMRVNESNDMGYVVKFAKKKDGKIETAWYRSKEDAEKALASLKKDGLNGIISKGRMDEEARDLKFGNITVITITKDGKRKEIEKKDLQRWKDDGWKLAEEAPANNASSGNVDMNPTGKKAKLQKKKDDILKRMGVNIKENLDNNNVVLKGINDTLNTLEDKIDGFSGIKKEEVKLKPKKKTFNEKFLKQLADNTPHTGQFDEKL